MVYSYLLDLYRVLGEREREIKKQQENSLSLESEEYLQGRLAAVSDFTSFLRDNFHAKLPRRLRCAPSDEESHAGTGAAVTPGGAASSTPIAGSSAALEKSMEENKP